MMSYDYPHPVSRTYQYKKITKPLLERKRRARINRCLDELKDLMVDALETEGENISKLEKADILELTVRHLQRLHASRPSGLSLSASPNDDASSKESRWQSGFGHCAAEACRYLAALPGESGERLARHLASGLQSNRQSNNPLSPKVELPFPAHSLERTANLAESRSPCLPMETTETMTNSQQVKSSIASSRHSIVSETSDNQEISNTASISLYTFENDERDPPTPNLNSCLVAPKNADNEQSVTVTTTENRIFKTDNRIIGPDDEEEIDVEGVDESDPMWRPW